MGEAYNFIAMRCGALLLLGLLLGGCAAAPVVQSAQDLWRDDLFRPPSERISAAAAFALSEPMKRFVRQELATSHKAPRQALIDAVSQGRLRLEYDSARTRTAAEAFDARAGNCLSLVILTAAFAKELGIAVQYNRATHSDMWSRSGNIYFLNGHVNLTLGKRDADARTLYDAAELVTIDFLPGEDLRGLRTQPLEEATILAMYLNNRAAESLLQERLDDAYWWAREATRIGPAFLAGLNTLGVVYLRRGELAAAERVLRRVLAAEADNTRGLANLALVLGRLGRTGEAGAVERELARVEREGPFYFFHRGLAAMEAGDYRLARSLFKRELARAPDYHEFHFWLALAELKLGNVSAARSELVAAQEASSTRREHDLYAAKLQRLSAIRH